MDAISYSLADKQAKRIKKVISDPDSTSGVVTVPKVIPAGETITIPAGRTAVLPNVQVDGTLTVDGDLFVPSGATVGDLENQIALKAPIDNPTFTGIMTASGGTNIVVVDANYIDINAIGANPTATLYSDGTIVGSTDNGDYVKYPNGELKMHWNDNSATAINANTNVKISWYFPYISIGTNYYISVVARPDSSSDYYGATYRDNGHTTTMCSMVFYNGATAQNIVEKDFIFIGRWK